MKKRPNLFSSAIFRLLLIILAVVIPLNILTLVLSRTVLRDVERQISLENQNALDLYVSQLDYTMSRAATAMNRFVRENVEFLTLSDKNTEGSAADAQMQSIVKLRYEIRKELEDHSMISGMLTSFPEKDIVTLDGAGNAQAAFVRSVLLEQINGQEFGNRKNWRIKEKDGTALLTFANRYRNGYYALWITMDTLLRPLSPKGNSDHALYIVTDQQGITCGATQGGPERLDLSLTSVRLDGKDYIQVISAAKQADLCVVQLLPRNEISRLLPAATRVLMILSFAALLLIPLLMLAIQKLVIAPINKLLDAMERIDQGDLEYRIDTAKTYGSEFDALNRHFNYTMDEVKDLKIRVYEEKLKAQKIHLRFLSQQIRPHFILNTLNILYSYEKEDFPLIQRMILCLSRYFRYVVNANEDYVLLGQEIEHIRNYFEIQQARFLRTFQSEIVCDESLYSCMIPPLLIQSFAENAIKYALRPGEVISIAIRAEATADERLHISVIDNGTGISAEALEKIQRFVQKREYQKDLGVGIQNAIDRMDLLYHGKGSVQVSKNEPRGTRVDIMMPIQRKELSDDECDFD